MSGLLRAADVEALLNEAADALNALREEHGDIERGPAAVGVDPDAWYLQVKEMVVDLLLRAMRAERGLSLEAAVAVAVQTADLTFRAGVLHGERRAA